MSSVESLKSPVAMGPLSTKHNADDSTAIDSSQKTGSSVSIASDTQMVGEITNGDNGLVNDNKDEVQIYYAVHVPLDSQIPSSDMIDCSSSVFEDKQEALKLVKKYKRARFKSFNTYEEAKKFSINGTGVQPITIIQSPIENNLSPAEPVPMTVGEKPSPFKGPKSQDLVRLRKSIENGDIQCVQKTVWENPRYLVSSGDTPAILHEGSRYNALHVCAKTNKANICSLILKTISNVDFIRRLYGDSSDSIDAAEDRCNMLLDLYLNTPDKGFNETPLHFAVKHGSLDVVRVLVAYSQCDKNMVNKFGQLPKDIICSRVSGSGDNGDLYKKISLLLEEQYFVPVLRSHDPSIQPTIGQPFSATKPLQLSGDIVRPAMEVQGVAGPMPLDTARVFRKKWKTPPRDPKSPVSPAIKTILQDPDKGLEKVGRGLADESKVGWTEFWPFLSTFANFRTEEGLSLLEQYLLKRFKQGAEPTSLQQTSSKTDFVGSYSTLPAATQLKSPISDLCDALRSCQLSSGGDSKKLSMPPRPISPPVHPQLNHERYNGIVQNDDTNASISPHLYIEKSCQVFAKRIADGLLRCPETPGEPIACEMVHLSMLVASCLGDSRFATVNFSRLHCRLATCVVDKFLSEDKDVLFNAVNIILNKKREAEESSSEEETTLFRDTNTKRIRKRRKISVDSSVRCITQQISNFLPFNDFDNILPANPPLTEEDCMRLWQSAKVCDCIWSPQQSRTRHSFRRSNYSSLVRRIDFLSDDKDEKRNDEADMNTLDNDGRVIEKAVECCEESAGEESDTSDTECGDFFTPPSSPRNQCSPVTSEDELAMESPDEGPDVYIIGDVPTNMDNAVLDAIGPEDLDPAVYPNICRWKHLITMHSPAERECWYSPRISITAANHYRRMLSTPTTPSSFGTPNFARF